MFSTRLPSRRLEADDSPHLQWGKCPRLRHWTVVHRELEAET
jgi:hypothetical protein